MVPSICQALGLLSEMLQTDRQTDRLIYTYIYTYKSINSTSIYTYIYTQIYIIDHWWPKFKDGECHLYRKIISWFYVMSTHDVLFNSKVFWRAITILFQVFLINTNNFKSGTAQLFGALEYTDCISVEW